MGNWLPDLRCQAMLGDDDLRSFCSQFYLLVERSSLEKPWGTVFAGPVETEGVVAWGMAQLSSLLCKDFTCVQRGLHSICCRPPILGLNGSECVLAERFSQIKALLGDMRCGSNEAWQEGLRTEPVTDTQPLYLGTAWVSLHRPDSHPCQEWLWVESRPVPGRCWARHWAPSLGAGDQRVIFTF